MFNSYVGFLVPPDWGVTLSAARLLYHWACAPLQRALGCHFGDDAASTAWGLTIPNTTEFLAGVTFLS